MYEKKINEMASRLRTKRSIELTENVWALLKTELKKILIFSRLIINISISREIRANKSIALSAIIVPNNLSTGIFSFLCSAVHLVISPALGIAKFVK